MGKAILLMALLLLSCIPSTKTEVESQVNQWEQLQFKIDSLYSNNFKDDEPGVAVLVAYDGQKILANGFGVRNLKTKEPLTDRSNMELASVSKQFTALAILSLVDQNRISLSDTVIKYLPYETFSNVTIQQLINHTSGLDDAEDYFQKNLDTTKIATNNDILNWYIEKDKRVTTADQVFDYNNGAYELLPLIVEKVAQQPYPEFLKRNIFDKAGMTSTIAYDLNEPADIEERAFYYSKDSLGEWKQMDGHPLTGIFGAGGIYTSLSDYFNYEQALRKRKIVDEELHNLIFKPTSKEVNNGVEHNYAMGWFVDDSIAEHSGGWYGVNTFARIYLNKPLTVAFFANRDDFFDNSLIKVTDSIVNAELTKIIAKNN